VTDAGFRSRLTARLTDTGFAAGWGAVKLLPEGVARRAFDAGAAGAGARDGKGIRQLRANLRVVTGGRLSEAELDELTGRAMRSYARYWREAFRLPTLSSRQIVEGTDFVGAEHLEKARADGRPMVLVLPHSGNWDAAGVWLVDFLGGPFMTVAERLEPESLFRRFVEYRETLGMRIVPLAGGERPSATVLREWLTDGGTICLVMDRDLGASGIPVTFFGRPTTMPGGAALLAARTGAALHPAVCSFTPGGWRVVVRPEVALDDGARLRDRMASATQAVADVFAEGIATQPEDWHMLGRIWSDVPRDPPRTTPRRGAD
jgi:lauroyl/myristoyl acyltransferase